MEYKVRTIRTVEEFLSNARDMNRLIGSTQEAIDNLTPPRCTIGGMSHTRDNTEPGKQVRRFELEQQLVEYMEGLMDYNDALVKIMRSDDFTPREKIIVQQRYIMNKTWKEVASFMDQTEDNIRKIDGRFRAKLYKKPMYWRNI